jgi:hypothetical protein
MRRASPLVLTVLLAASAVGLAEAVRAQPEGAPGLSDGAEVSLLTMLPGDEVYSLFGHSALRVRDPASGLDRTYNFGTFSFDQPFFVLRFLRGSLDYQLDTDPFWAVLQSYRAQRRPIVEQALRLPPEAVRALYARLEENALPENRAYRYDFFWDNCSTRLLDAVDSALVDVGGPALDLPPAETPETFRQLLRPYWAATPAVELGANLGLGIPADRVATAREEAFLPLELAAQLDRAAVGGRPLVARRDTLFWVEGAGLPASAPDVPLWTAWLLLAVGVAGTAWGWRRPPSALARWADAALFAAVGFAGLVLLLLWTATAHAVTGPNLNVLWAWPTHLVAAWAVASRRDGGRWRAYFLVATAASALVAVSWAVLPQSLPLPALPVVLLVALRTGVRAVLPVRQRVVA